MSKTRHHTDHENGGTDEIDVTGLTGASGGSVATDTIWDAKGDLAVGTGADTASKLTAGADDTILMADAAAGTGLKWVAPATPSTQAFGDAAAAGTGDTFTRGDHKHAMPADPVTAHAAASDPHTGYRLESASILPADLDVTADNTTADSTTGHHGLLPKLGGGSSNYLRADGSWAAPSGSGAPASVDYLVGTADGGLSAEIVVGTTPGGELGGTWASPTVDATHSGSAHVALPAYSAWTPALTAVTTNPTLGSGSTAQGRYFQSGKQVVGYGAITFGTSGVVAGSGTYIVSLPITSRARSNNDMNMMGQGYVFDSSASALRPCIYIYNTTTTVTIRLTTDGSTINNSAPWTWAASDVIVFHVDYEAA